MPDDTQSRSYYLFAFCNSCAMLVIPAKETAKTQRSSFLRKQESSKTHKPARVFRLLFAFCNSCSTMPVIPAKETVQQTNIRHS